MIWCWWINVNQQELNRQAHRKLIEEISALSPQETRQRLIESGILTQDGELAPQYKLKKVPQFETQEEYQAYRDFQRAVYEASPHKTTNGPPIPPDEICRFQEKRGINTTKKKK